MPTRTDRHQVFDGQGNVVGETTEVVDITAAVNRATIEQQAAQALAANKTFVAAAKPATAAAQASAAYDAAVRLTRQQNGVIRLLLGLLDATD